ncbi:MAG: LLM class F420-dependent oxidoreductase [Gammaproteobacteria bacterium]|jgi:probable F420-dependent oxidoreductase|nr:LLM class F420-dependent oxidoreductase [Gammaproteobacteria bacterium]MBT5202238.1 LLM class F420-dependent oxidoreductase [Gammaproteobacteria bacterium]MBT5601685.1 LLM class F420-dependent oxidoreductase [Gammaproteobacteria bacterium]MBT6245252.1 LLM class F420-dependent oxidoreductase [Gammaproteobacteria bacterium]
MKYGLIPVNLGVSTMQQMVGMAQKAESLGYESVWTFEHVIVPLDYQSKYPYSASGKMGGSPDVNFIDPLIALSFIAAATEKIRLGTGVNILSQANPMYVAKQSASLDLLSNGRFMLGVGIGWLEEEFAALGVPFERRGARFDDYLQGMRKVWSGEVVEHQSEFLNWSGFKSYPMPMQDPLPVIMGGSKGKIHERIALYGNGWFAPTSDLAELARHLDEIRKQCDLIDRDYNEIEISIMWSGQTQQEQIDAYQDLGVERMVVPLFALGADPLKGMSELAEKLIG